MNFKKVLRLLTFPVSIIYGSVIHVRNFLFDKKILRSTSFDMPIICVGNISVGGTGKTPMVEYLIKLLQQQNLLQATISRGYRRKTKGFLIANKTTTANEIGDEPMQFHTKFPDVNVCVGKDRVNAVQQFLQLKPETKAIILDDAFQHRKITAGLNILLTDYNNLFYKDYFLPTGTLRDQRSSAKRADIIVVTKCDHDLLINKKEKIINQINRFNQGYIFFTTINYGKPCHISVSEEFILNNETHYILVHGIANANSLRNYIASFDKNFEEISFKDHHNFTQNDIEKIIGIYQKKTGKTVIITTEKDAVKLKWFNELSALPLYVLPIETSFLFNQKDDFDNTIKNFVLQFNNNNNEQKASAKA
ncbi:tetraacyldisaccharide 4'-kinase [Arachidicoccus ginsenosidimutans]|uniref:tetraacyldisaccharide 4'-kinase n=1 Tax=Arachidicoccus sp. BS20 TaxID=1850526 RepID=UPI0007F06B63|nr:tetraacyldisaccharide 4'-kinase [Arachidicoccus sp. BS20]ANI88401.1 tetraacyldisaccharide 4'-kinase [Arachidicoccus sp. BS20]